MKTAVHLQTYAFVVGIDVSKVSSSESMPATFKLINSLILPG
jgi:hypothetical protein